MQHRTQAHGPHTADPERGRRRLVATVILLAMLLYAVACAPGVLWQDSATFQYRVHEGMLRSDLGLALAHPLYILLAKAFSALPIGNTAFRVNLFSGLCAAVCLGFIADLLLSLTRSRFAAICGTLLLAVSHTFWRHAVMAEVYTLYALGLAAELWLLERFHRRGEAAWFVTALFINGLSASNHLLAVLHLPVYAGILFASLRSRRLKAGCIPLASGAWFLGALPYLALIIADLAHGQPLGETLHSALFGNSFSGKVLNVDVAPWRECKRTVQYFCLNFPTPLLLASPWGAWLAWKDARTRWFALVASGLFGIAFIFAYRYDVPDQYVFFFPCYVLTPLFVAVAVQRLVLASPVKHVLCLALAGLPLLAYEVAPALCAKLGVSIGARRSIPYRDSLAYFLRPRKNGESGSARFAREALDAAAPDGLLIADSTIMNVLAYVRDIEGVQPGVTLTGTANFAIAEPVVELTPEAIAAHASRGTAYTCSIDPGYLPSWLAESYHPVPYGVVYRLEPNKANLAIPPKR